MGRSLFVSEIICRATGALPSFIFLQDERQISTRYLGYRQRLEALPGWSWSAQWEETFSYLKEFSDREGHCRVSANYKTDDGYRLGVWVSNQRVNKDTMETGRQQRLEALPGCSWDILSDQWEKGFCHLKLFSEREGHWRVPCNSKTDDGYLIGSWVVVQRLRKDTMDTDRRQRLEALSGWSWNAFDDK